MNETEENYNIKEEFGMKKIDDIQNIAKGVLICSIIGICLTRKKQ